MKLKFSYGDIQENTDFAFQVLLACSSGRSRNVAVQCFF